MLKWISARAEANRRPPWRPAPDSAHRQWYACHLPRDWPDICRLGSTDTGTGVASRKGKAIDGNVMYGRTVMIRDAIFHNHATGKPVFFLYKL